MATSSRYQPAIRTVITQCTRQTQHARSPWQARCLFAARRNFSSTPRATYPGTRIDPRSAGMKSGNRQSRPSMKVAMQKMQREMGSGDPEELVVKDLGLLDKTMIYPTGGNLPKLTSPGGFMDRMRLLRRWLSTRLGDIYMVYFSYRYLIDKTAKQEKPKMHRRLIAPTAAAIHEKVYTAFAEGDKATLRKLCVESVLGQYMNRLARRPANERMRWSIVRHIQKPRLVSHRGVQLPMLVEGFKAGMRQCVVRITTLQRLQIGYVKGRPGSNKDTSAAATASMYGRPQAPRALVRGKRDADVENKKEGEEEEEHIEWRAPTEKEVTEYVVIQRWMIRGEERPWALWGFADETTVEDLQEGTPDLGMRRLE